MRLPIAVLALLALPASAQAGVVGLEGTQLVYRSDPGEEVKLLSGYNGDGVFFFSGRGVRPGPGCGGTEGDVECPPAGVAGVTLVTGDGNDTVAYFGHLTVTMTLGAGSDRFHGQAQAVVADLGPGNDVGLAETTQASVVGGEGDDQLDLYVEDFHKGPSTLDGGAGDDALSLHHIGAYAALPGGLRPGRAAPVAIVCGPGADRWSAGPYDLPGDGCAPTLTGITTKTVSRPFRDGTRTAPASGSVTLRRLDDWGRGRERIAHGTFPARSGPLRVSLKRTAAGRERLRQRPRLPVAVSIETRSGRERGEVSFNSRMGT
ncbi:hypothetical protein C8N24_6049 [Solirubrobacter pauli]|uniref:Uncharacterized protein n=1 Tax=Solirubrobacter pauli TaxID=166793 RepID=A0A660L7V6_9ACTN|nr:hypothetical protein [Solirubrobacter pauli]RKQ88013.1 hypothetical protein C8N24_6049 [Solirubrobacter pauli]